MKRSSHTINLKLNSKLLREIRRYCQHEGLKPEIFIEQVLSERMRQLREQLHGSQETAEG